jgi:5-hydroxyisourate hydrolase-like protein (transthyretin family)
MFGAVYYAVNIPRFAEDRQQTLVFGPSRFSPETSGALRVVVRDTNTQKPIENADIKVSLAPKGIGAPQTLYAGKTDARGTAPVAFNIPADAAREQMLVIETRSGSGRDRIEKPVIVQRNYKVLVTTDKPLYQPSQTMHLRALALGALDRAPAKDQKIEFIVEDPKGNKVFRRSVQSSAYGVASVDFVLADAVNAGDYKISATIGDSKSEKTVNVKPYVLPKFKVSAETERTFYLPGEKVAGRVRADYFFGKPVAKSDVTLKGIVYDVARAETVNLTGKTDANGVYNFSFTLPNYFAGRGLDRNRADFALEISVTDLANHTEQTSLVLPIASDPIIIDAVPESGRLVAGVENVVYILTSLPDGSPLEAALTVAAATGTIQARTGKYGLAEVRLTPPRGANNLAITARDASGRSATRTITLQTETTANQILLRPERATYRVGETMHLDAFTSGSVGTVYLDIIKESQTLSTRALDAVNGRASADIDVSAELIGTVQLHAYHVELNGTIVRDTRVVVVEAPSELSIAIKADRDVYRPGDNSKVTFNVTDRAGKGVPSALGVAAVDESVFALAEQDPGFAKLYFLLQKELLEPKYQVKGFTLPEVVTYNPAKDPATVQGQQLRAAQDQSARAAWANATPFDFVLRVNSQPEKREAANKAQVAAFNNIAAWLALILSIVPLGIGGFVIASLHRKKILGKSFAWWMGAALAYCFISPFFVAMVAVIGYVFVQAQLGVVVVAVTILAWLVGFGVLVAHAIVKRDLWVQVTLLLLMAYLLFLGMFLYVGGKAATLNEWLAFAVIMTYLAALASVVLLGVGLLIQKENAPGFAAILLAVLFIPATILLAIMPTAGPFLRALGNPALYTPIAYITGCAPAGTPAPGTGNIFRDLQSGLSGPQMLQPMMTPVPTSVTGAKEAAPGTAPTGAAEPPRLRQYFPETLYFDPQVITDESGRASLDIPLADSITTWRLSVTASSQRGELGANSAGIRVFQDFFVDLDLPVALTQNDEISIPVAVYNYLPQSQKVRLQIEKQSWFQLQDNEEKTLTIASNDIDVVYFRIKASQFGMQKLKVTAIGDKMSDAIQREIRVYPDGKLTEFTASNWLKGDTQQVVDIPAVAIPGASRIEVKIYPSIVAQAVNGLDGMLRMPFG